MEKFVKGKRVGKFTAKFAYHEPRCFHKSAENSFPIVISGVLSCTTQNAFSVCRTSGTSRVNLLKTQKFI